MGTERIAARTLLSRASQLYEECVANIRKSHLVSDDELNAALFLHFTPRYEACIDFKKSYSRYEYLYIKYSGGPERCHSKKKLRLTVH